MLGSKLETPFSEPSSGNSLARMQIQNLADTMFLNLCVDVLASVDRKSWDFQPVTEASKQFVRGGKQSRPILVKGLARFAFDRPTAPDTPREPA